MKANQLPSVLKMCFGQLKKLVYEENPDFDRKENIEQSILETTMKCNSMIRELTKLKAEYFQSTESIVNKDTNYLKIAQVQQ